MSNPHKPSWWLKVLGILASLRAISLFNITRLGEEPGGGSAKIPLERSNSILAEFVKTQPGNKHINKINDLRDKENKNSLPADLVVIIQKLIEEINAANYPSHVKAAMGNILTEIKTQFISKHFAQTSTMPYENISVASDIFSERNQVVSRTPNESENVSSTLSAPDMFIAGQKTDDTNKRD